MAGVIQPKTYEIREISDLLNEAKRGEHPSNLLSGHSGVQVRGVPHGVIYTEKGDKYVGLLFSGPHTMRFQGIGVTNASAMRAASEVSQTVELRGYLYENNGLSLVVETIVYR